uniref:Uncharacterized protein n=1 Tax=Anopheles albimanus TaxID=7167 RepID=A0A182FWH0_ANOAL
MLFNPALVRSVTSEVY